MILLRFIRFFYTLSGGRCYRGIGLLSALAGTAKTTTFRHFFKITMNGNQIVRVKYRSNNSRARLLPSSLMTTDLALLFGSEM